MNARSRRKNYGQNFLVHSGVIDDMVSRVDATDGPILEIGPGSGALTRPLASLDRPVTAVEIDPNWAKRLSLPGVNVIRDDFLRYVMPADVRTIISNVPFSITTAILRKLLDAPDWNDAILLVQWDVARRRSGSTLLSMQWAPWFTFTLGRRVPAAAFRPRPAVDGGILQVSRRQQPLLPASHRHEFQSMLERVFFGRGRGVAEILTKQRLLSRRGAEAWCRRQDLSPRALPPQVPVGSWIDLFETTGVSPPRTR